MSYSGASVGGLAAVVDVLLPVGAGVSYSISIVETLESKKLVLLPVGAGVSYSLGTLEQPDAARELFSCPLGQE